MYVILILEIKLGVYESCIEYVYDEILGPYDKQECIDTMQTLVDETVARGYFTEVKLRYDKKVILSNGGTVTKMFLVDRIDRR